MQGLYELSTLIASNKKSLHSYEAILFDQINVIGTEWYYIDLTDPQGMQ